MSLHASSCYISSRIRNLAVITGKQAFANTVAQRLKSLPPVREMGWEDPLEKEMVTHSSILAWRIPWTEEPGSLQSMGLQRVRHD